MPILVALDEYSCGLSNIKTLATVAKELNNPDSMKAFLDLILIICEETNVTVSDCLDIAITKSKINLTELRKESY